MLCCVYVASTVLLCHLFHTGIGVRQALKVMQQGRVSVLASQDKDAQDAYQQVLDVRIIIHQYRRPPNNRQISAQSIESVSGYTLQPQRDARCCLPVASSMHCNVLEGAT